MLRVYLVGFMGCGKTSVGAALAATLGYRFLDLDTRLVEHFGASIGEVFAERGEAVFRRAESELLVQTAGERGVVIAAGGGAFCTPENRRVMHLDGGVTVFLHIPWESVVERLPGDNPERPRFVTAARARQLYEERQPHYRQATLTVDLSGDESPEDVAARIAGRLLEAACAT